MEDNAKYSVIKDEVENEALSEITTNFKQNYDNFLKTASTKQALIAKRALKALQNGKIEEFLRIQRSIGGSV